MKNIRTFVISLKETPARTEYILEQCKLQNINAELFTAINGERLGLTTVLPNKLEHVDREVKLTNGNIGCLLSHLMLWKLLLYLPQNEFLILENDCIFCNGFEGLFDKLYDKLPLDWEMVYVGWIRYGHDVVKSVIAEGISVRIPSATHAYMVKKIALPKLIDSIYPITSPLDLQLIDRILPQLKYYVFDPSLVNQKTYLNFSDAQWLSTNYDWDMDIYKVKRNLIRKFKFLDGWHQEERNQNDIWRWSEDTFTLSIPPQYKTKMKFSSAIENSLTLESDAGHSQTCKIISGNNEIEFMNDVGISSFRGKVKIPFIPSQNDPNSKDKRVLGICLKGLEIKVTDNQWIPVKISSISKVSS